MEQNKNHKVVRVKRCDSKLQFVKAIKTVTNKSLLESKNIADSLIDCHGRSNGVILLNESSITPSEWEEIAATSLNYGLEWEYV